MIPTLSNTTFEALGIVPVLCEALTKLKWERPTMIQQESIPVALAGSDLIGLASTGSGKTGAFALPIIQALLEEQRTYFALVLAPTHELAIQIAETFDAIGIVIGLRTCVIVGGGDVTQQALLLARKPHVIVATPGRILHHLQHTKGFSLRNLEYLVLDEADRMLSMNFQESLISIISELPARRKTMLFSATMTSSVKKLQRASFRNQPVKVSVTDNRFGTVAELKQTYVLVPAKWKACYLSYMLAEFSGNAVMVFCGACQTASKLCLMAKTLGLTATVLTGKMSQAARLQALTKFKAQDKNVLFATEVASRGLDIPSIDLVINYDIPTNAKDYVHRVGRTARAGRAGNAVSFVTQYDVEMFKQIEGLVGVRMNAYPLEEEEVLRLLPQVETATKLAAEQIKTEEVEARRRKKTKHGGASKDSGTIGGPGKRDTDSEKSSRLSYRKKAKVEKKKIE